VIRREFITLLGGVGDPLSGAALRQVRL